MSDDEPAAYTERWLSPHYIGYPAVGILAFVIGAGMVANGRPPKAAPATAASTSLPAAEKPHATTAAPTKPTPEPTASDAARAAAALANMRGVSWRGTSWAPHIKAITVRGDALWVETDLYPKDSNRDVASKICGAISGYQIAEEGRFTGVRVAASDGRRLAMRNSLGDPC